MCGAIYIELILLLLLIRIVIVVVVVVVVVGVLFLLRSIFPTITLSKYFINSFEDNNRMMHVYLAIV